MKTGCLLFQRRLEQSVKERNSDSETAEDHMNESDTQSIYLTRALLSNTKSRKPNGLVTKTTTLPFLRASTLNKTNLPHLGSVLS